VRDFARITLCAMLQRKTDGRYFMSFNLIGDRWLPCRRASGARVWLAPHVITSQFGDDPILTLDFPRPDWNAAVTELLIGLLSATIPPHSADDWAERWITPPPPGELQSALAPLTFAFDLDSEGPRCFQDLAPLESAEPKSVASLLIDAPGDNTVKENKDLFIKRNGITALSLPYAAAALITLQTYAPSGGQGNRTSMRGGGPLTVLISPRRRNARLNTISTLWELVWSNVRDYDEDAPPIDGDLPHDDRRWSRVFPWLAGTRQSKGDIPTLPIEHADLLQVYFALPRRIRLDFEPETDTKCSLGGPTDGGCVRTYRQINYGTMYSGWRHPLSPYYVDKKNGLLPFHPQPGLVTYADWLAWWGLRDGQSALNLAQWRERLYALGAEVVDLQETRQHGLHAFGFDMDNMKARGWLDERIPYFEPPQDAPPIWAQHFQATVTQLVEAAKATADQLKYELRRNQFGKWDTEKQQYKLLDTAPKDAFDEVATQLWAETQEAFVQSLDRLHQSDAQHADRSVRTDFMKSLRSTALRLFDGACDIDSLADQNARRLVEARKGLVIALSPGGKVAVVLGIAETKSKKGGGSRGGKS